MLKDKVFALRVFTTYSKNKGRSFTLHNTKLTEIRLASLNEGIADIKYHKGNDMSISFGKRIFKE